MASQQKSAGVILVVEDEWIIRQMIIDRLADDGFEVVEAASGEDALAKIKANPSIDVIFTDISLGGRINGWQVAGAFRKRYPEAGVVFTSGQKYVAPATVPGSLFYQKPYDPARIATTCGQLAHDAVPA